MITIYLLVLLCYAFNITVIVQYAKEVGRFEFVDLVHILFSPFTVVNVFIVKILSNIMPLDQPLWIRDTDENDAQR